MKDQNMRNKNMKNWRYENVQNKNIKENMKNKNMKKENIKNVSYHVCTILALHKGAPIPVQNSYLCMNTNSTFAFEFIYMHHHYWLSP